jgi:hypothetical protein
LTLVCTSPNFREIKTEMKKYNDVPFGCNSPTALLRRGQASIIIIWSIFVLTSLPIHLFMNGISGFAIETFPVTGQVIDANNLASNGTTLPTDCANYLANAQNWVTDFTNITIFVKNESYMSKYKAFVEGWNAGVEETDGPPSPNEISSCFVETAVAQCSITIRWFPLVVTSIAILIKSITAFIAIRRSRHFKYRLYNSLGDFIAVATRHREELAVPGECLANKGEWNKSDNRALRGGEGIPRRASRGLRIWIQYLGILDWIVWVFWVTSVAAICYLTGISLAQVQAKFKDADSQTITSIFDLFGIAGFGRPSLAFIVGNSSPAGGTSFDGREPVGFPLQIALANSPQLWFSVGYLLWNNQITRICGEHEWRSYENRRKLPRVSYGASLQGTRNTRWLQLPYSVSIILMVVSTAMHWIVSQTLFVVEVENQSGLPVLNGTPTPPGLVYIICYSPTAIFVTACLSGLLILKITIYYVYPFRSCMPFMAGSARVVFASCTALPRQLPKDGVMWGDVSDQYGRLAGFGENARAIRVGEIYPERWNRQPTPSGLRAPSPSRNIYTSSSRASGVPSAYRETSYFDGRISQAETEADVDLGEGELRYPEDASTYTQPEAFTSQRSAELQPLRIPPTRVRPVTSSTMASPLAAPNSSYSSRKPPSPTTRRPGSRTELGTGYGSSSNRNTLHDVSEFDTPSRGNSPHRPSRDEGSEWQGWGINTGRNQRRVSESEDESPVRTVEWKGWGVNPD